MMQPSRLPSVANSEDEEPPTEDELETEDTKMADPNTSKTPRQQKAQEKKEHKQAQQSQLAQQRAGVGGKKVGHARLTACWR